MKELESVLITNPTSESFTRRWNGEPYTIAAGETKGFAAPVSFHLAKHLSTSMLEKDFPRKKKFLNEQEKNMESLKFSNLILFDNAKRRIALFKILNDVKMVMEVIAAYPFKGFMEGEFLGTMQEYKDFVKERGGKFEVEPKGKPTLEVLQEQIEELKKKLEEKEVLPQSTSKKTK